METKDVQRVKSEWRKKTWSIPDLPGGKQDCFSLVVRLVRQISIAPVTDLDTCPFAKEEISAQRTWREYVPFLKVIGLTSNRGGALFLTDYGVEFNKNESPRYLADLMHDKIRLFGELLEILRMEPGTVQEADLKLCKNYRLDWRNCSNTRRRLDWLETLGLIESIGSRKWKPTVGGLNALDTWELVTPDIIASFESITNEVSISVPPQEIAILLQRLRDDPELHKKRSTYNIWVPSPSRIDNLRTIVHFALDRICFSLSKVNSILK